MENLAEVLQNKVNSIVLCATCRLLLFPSMF